MARGRGKPSKYETFVQSKLYMICEWASKGLTDQQICSNLGIHVSTFCTYKNKYPELVEALKQNKDAADLVIENAMYKNAAGFDYEEVTEELVGDVMTITKRIRKVSPPNTTAGIYWLNNRQPKKFRTRQDLGISGSVEFTSMTKEQAEDLIKQFLQGENNAPTNSI